MKAGEDWMKQQITHYSIHEAALIFEAGVNKRLDYVIGVYTLEPLRIKRVMERDSLTYDDVLKRMNRQMNEDAKMKLCDFVLINDEEQLLMSQVLKLHEQLLQLKKP